MGDMGTRRLDHIPLNPPDEWDERPTVIGQSSEKSKAP